MALVLVRLKLALLRGSIRRGGAQGVIAMVLSGLAAVGVGGVTGLVLAALRTATVELRAEVALAALGVAFVVWLLGPVTAAASEGTLPPDRLAPFPLTARQLMPGLMWASLVGFGGLCSVLVAIGLVVGVAPTSPLALVTVAAVVAHLLVCVTFSRLLITALSGLARRRRGRDLALVLGPVLALGANVAINLVVVNTGRVGQAVIDHGAWRVARRVLMVLPSGPPGLAVAEAARGNAVGALAALAACVPMLVLGLWLWRLAFDRAVTTFTDTAVSARGKAGSLFPRFLAFLPRNRWGAVAARDLRLTWRDPRQRAQLFATLIIPAFSIMSRSFTSSGSESVLFAAAVPFFIGLGSTNLWGFDGRAAWTNAVAAGDPRDDVVGKLVARLLFAAPLTLGMIALLAVRAGSAGHVLNAVVLSVAAFGITVGPAAVLAARSPSPVPDSQSNVFSSGSSGQGFGQGMAALGLMVGASVVLAPLAVLLVVFDSAVVRAVVSLVLLALGAGGFTAGVRSAGAYLRTREPELVAALSFER